MTILDWFYPRRCLLCRKLLPEDRAPVPVCSVCRLRELHGACGQGVLPDGTQAVWAVRYAGLARQVLLRYKFRAQPGLCRYLARLMAQALAHEMPDSDFDLITYVPTGFFRVLRRGYDQSGLLARELARELGLPCRALLCKRGFNRAQHQLPTERRAANVRGVYRCRGSAPPGVTRVLLVDDVITTGSTLASAAGVLTAQGLHVTGLCFASAGRY